MNQQGNLTGAERPAVVSQGLPNAKIRYGVILADPPWCYHNSLRGSAASQYPTMKPESICDLPVAALAAEDSVLLLWATWPMLPMAMQVIERWGFRYVTGFPWVKVCGISMSSFGGIEIHPRWGVGFWARGASEPLLIAKRGKAKPPEMDFMGLLGPNVRHSRKPDSAYEFAEALPGPYLELFARRTRPGWHVWGNEIACDVVFPQRSGCSAHHEPM